MNRHKVYIFRPDYFRLETTQTVAIVFLHHKRKHHLHFSKIHIFLCDQSYSQPSGLLISSPSRGPGERLFQRKLWNFGKKKREWLQLQHLRSMPMADSWDDGEHSLRAIRYRLIKRTVSYLRIVTDGLTSINKRVKECTLQFSIAMCKHATVSTITCVKPFQSETQLRVLKSCWSCITDQ